MDSGSGSNNITTNQKRRVVVTGLGTLSPVGNSVSEAWASLAAGKSGIGPITRFDVSKIPTRIAGEVKGFNPDTYMSPKESRKLGLFIQYAIVAGYQALQDAGLKYPFHAEGSTVNPRRIGVSIASGMGGMPEISYWDRELHAKEKKSVTPFFVPMIIPNMASGQLSILTGAQGPNTCIVTACSSSAHAVGESYRYIQDGYADVMISGGTEAVVSELGIVGFTSMKALSTRNDEPTKASRPYDKDRDGFVLSEGATVLILEEYEHAKRRGAKIYAEVAGYGLNADAYHMTAPSPEGAGAAECMRIALERAGMTAGDIDYVNTHGTSTPAGDAQEAMAVARVFGAHKDKVHVSSTKSMTGHLLGAAGAFESLVSVLSIRDGIVPPTINLDNLDDESASTGINFTPHKAVKRPIRAALSNSFGFGGTNATLIFKSL